MQQVLQNTICILNRKCGAWSVERGGRDLGNKLIEIERKFCRPSRAKVGGTFPFSLFFMFIDFLLLLLYFFALATLCLLFGIASLFSFVRLLFADYILAPHLHAHPHPPYIIYTLALTCLLAWNNECHFGLDPRHGPRRCGSCEFLFPSLWVLTRVGQIGKSITDSDIHFQSPQGLGIFNLKADF